MHIVQCWLTMGALGEKDDIFGVVHVFTVQDINSLDVSPNDKLIVSGSQDKTAKVKPNPPVSNTTYQNFSC